MDVLPVDRGSELSKRVQPLLMSTPVVAGAPVLGQLFHVFQGDAVVPARAGQLVGPAGPGQPGPQVVQIGLRDIDAERPDSCLAGFVMAVHLLAGARRPSGPFPIPSPSVG